MKETEEKKKKTKGGKHKEKLTIGDIIFRGLILILIFIIVILGYATFLNSIF